MNFGKRLGKGKHRGVSVITYMSQGTKDSISDIFLSMSVGSMSFLDPCQEFDFAL